jgi:hypothetical protein
MNKVYIQSICFPPFQKNLSDLMSSVFKEIVSLHIVSLHIVSLGVSIFNYFRMLQRIFFQFWNMLHEIGIYAKILENIFSNFGICTKILEWGSSKNRLKDFIYKSYIWIYMYILGIYHQKEMNYECIIRL